MITSNDVEKNASIISNKETKITALTLLKGFYDEQIFSILIREFYDDDLEISLAAIRASGSIGNEVAIPHLYRIIEHGKTGQQVAAAQTLAQINAPSAIESLAKYFTYFKRSDVRRELLRSMNIISPLHPATRELTRTVLQDSSVVTGLYQIVLPALLEAGELEQVKSHLFRATPDVQREVFKKLLEVPAQQAGPFVESFLGQLGKFDPLTLGCVLCAYELKFGNPQATFIVDTLQTADPRATASFMKSMSDYRGRIENSQRLFRLLLRLPYVDPDTEGMTGNHLGRILDEIKRESPLQLNEFIFTTATNLEAVFAKLKNQYISLKGIKERDALLAVVLAKTLEQYAGPALLAETQNFFRVESADNPTSLLSRLRERILAATEEERNRFEACLSLFNVRDRVMRLNIYHAVSRANPSTPILARRLNRLVRIIGALDIRNSGKKILEILNFAREERIAFLEETCTVTLCQLLNRTAIEQSKVVFAEPQKYPHSLAGYIRGARFVPPKIFVNPLVKLLLNPRLGAGTHLLAAESLLKMNLAGLRNYLPPLVRVLQQPGLDDKTKDKIAETLAAHGDSAIFQPLLDLSSSPDAVVRGLGIRTVRRLAQKEKNIPRDVLTNRLYQMLEDKTMSVRVSALMALLSLGDDYAAQVLDDYVSSRNEAGICEVLDSLEPGASHEVMSRVLRLLTSDLPKVHESLRRVLPPFCQGPLAEEIRTALLEILKEDDGSRALSKADVKSLASQSESLIGLAKVEFKFRRENAQRLTVFFADMVGFTGKGSIETVRMMKLIQAFEEITLPLIEALKGTLIKTMGDGLLAVFKHPLNATIAALRIQKTIEEYNQFRVEQERFRVRVGLNTGDVIRKGADVFGDTVNVASRMETSASPGEVLLTQTTFDEIKEFIRCTHLGPMQVKGKTEPIAAYSAEEILIDVDKVVAEGQTDAGAAASTAEGGSLANLKESMFTPEFDAGAVAGLSEGLGRTLASVFQDMSKQLEGVAQDYHEEYLFKRYLQEKWNQLVVSARQGMSAPRPTL
jgi:class 3 adenylate cyclase